MKEQEYEQINHPNGVTTWKTKPKHKEQAMNREDIIKLADAAGAGYFGGPYCLLGEAAIERFAALVAAAEREACAKVCETFTGSYERGKEMEACAAAIRARSKQ